MNPGESQGYQASRLRDSRDRAPPAGECASGRGDGGAEGRCAADASYIDAARPGAAGLVDSRLDRLGRRPHSRNEVWTKRSALPLVFGV
jgi:hypothetical protein